MAIVWASCSALALTGCVSAGDVAASDGTLGIDQRETVSSPPTAVGPATTQSPTTQSPTTEATTAPPTTVDPIDELLATLTLDQRVGQLLMPTMAGSSATNVSPDEAAANQRIAGTNTIAEAIETFSLGGVLYLGGNVLDQQQLTAMSSDLEIASQRSTPGIGVLIAVDQEGGRVNRVSDGVEVFPPARELSGNADAVRAAATATAVGLRAQGINVVLAPVADLAAGDEGVIGNRSYGDDPANTAEMVVASVLGLQEAGVAAGVKHWPGHGATTLDSHEVLPRIDVDEATWRLRERVPFAAAVTNDVAIVMVGHLALPGIDPSGQPATVSPLLVDQLLRADLGFDGVVITDALDMGAVEDQDPAELIVQSVEAGVDILLAPPDVAVAHAALMNAVITGRLSEARLDASVRRVLRLKQRLGLIT